MLRPSYQVKIGSTKFTPQNGGGIVGIRVVRSIGLPTDSCEIHFVEKEDSFEKGAPVKVLLGYDERLFPAFGGLVDNISQGTYSVRLTALGPALGLLRLRLNRVYLNQTAGKIVRDLAQEVNVNVSEASDGISFPMYVVDDTFNAYEHILRLAERCNFDAYITDDEKLVFKKSDGGQQHSLEYGQEIVSVEGLNLSPLYTGVRAYGESPSSVKGAETFHWLTKQEVKGEAGADALVCVRDAVIRDTRTAESVAESKLDRLRHTFVVTTEIVGNAEIKLGDTILLKNVPSLAIEGGLEVRGVEHQLSKTKGFTTRINCWMKGD